MIYINCHEPKEMINLLSKKAEIKIQNFSPGDYIVNDIAIERKTLNDFFNSLVSGRLFRQLSELKYYYSNPLLLLENFDLGFIKKTNIFYSVLIKILFDLNIKIIFSKCVEHSVEIIYLLDNKKSTSRFFMPLYKPTKHRESIERERLTVLRSVFNIGTKRAKSLLSEFKTVKNLIDAEEEEILAVKGIGKRVVERLKRI